MVDLLLLSRLQFAITVAFHFLFVPLTLGLAVLVACMETVYYKNKDEMMERFKLFIGQALCKCVNFTNPVFLKTVVEGLLAMYLSDKKIRIQGYGKMARELIRASGPSTMRCYQICSAVRRVSLIV